MLALTGCQKEDASVGYTETKLELAGASAEELKEVISSIAPDVQLAVIGDGVATLYQDGSKDEISKVLEDAMDRSPYGLMIAPPVEKKGQLPATPGQKEETQWSFEINSVQAKDLGVTTDDIVSRLSEVDAGQDDEALLEAFNQMTVNSISGADVSLSSLAEPKKVTVLRPLILTQ